MQSYLIQMTQETDKRPQPPFVRVYLANKILNVLTNDCSKLVRRALSDVEPYSWDTRAKNITKFIEFSKNC